VRGRRRQHFDEEPWSAFDSAIRDERELRVVEVDQVGLRDGGVREDDVEGSEEDSAEPVSTDVIPEDTHEVPEDDLMLRCGRRRHDQLTVEDLVPLAVVGQRRVVGVRQGRLRCHRGSLLASTLYRAMTTVMAMPNDRYS
jgi:hypothetical protein